MENSPALSTLFRLTPLPEELRDLSVSELQEMGFRHDVVNGMSVFCVGGRRYAPPPPKENGQQLRFLDPEIRRMSRIERLRHGWREQPQRAPGGFIVWKKGSDTRIDYPPVSFVPAKNAAPGQFSPGV